MVINELIGTGTLVPSILVKFQAAKGQLSVNGVSVADYSCEQPTLEASFKQG